jgi:hypothetical protein
VKVDAAQDAVTLDIDGSNGSILKIKSEDQEITICTNFTHFHLGRGNESSTELMRAVIDDVLDVLRGRLVSYSVSWIGKPCGGGSWDKESLSFEGIAARWAGRLYSAPMIDEVRYQEWGKPVVILNRPKASD